MAHTRDGAEVEAEVAESANLTLENFQALSEDERGTITDEYTMRNLRNMRTSLDDE